MKLDSAVLYSNDVTAAVRFYTDLGLSLITDKSPAFAALAFENGVQLAIKKSTEERESPGCQTIFIDSANIEEVFAKAKSKNLNIRKELTTQPWGQEFSLWDTDQNKVVFVKRS